jgi:hypothetical protein
MRRMRSMPLLVLILLVIGVVTAAQTKRHDPAWVSGVTFTFTGSPETFVVPRGGILLAEVWGAGGGGGASVPARHGQGGGGGGYARGILSVAAGDELTIIVGGGGTAGPVGTGGFGGDSLGDGHSGQGGAGGGGGHSLVLGPFIVVEACGGGGGGFNIGGSGEGVFGIGAPAGGGSNVCIGFGGQGATGALGGFNAGEGAIFRGGNGFYFTPGLGANGGAFRSIASGGTGQSNDIQPKPAEDGNPGLVRITYY